MKYPFSFVFPALFAVAPVVGQATPTAAEKEFQAAFWEETGKGKLDVALRGYLAAASADGPQATRARAMLRAAMVQHRLRQSDQARGTLQRLLEKFPKEGEVVTAARQKLEEWGRIAMRRNYSDWYQQHLFTPEIQARILGRLQELARIETPSRRSSKEARATKAKVAAVERDILVYGQGAVPALAEMARTGVTSGQTSLIQRATRLIFLVGRLPPVEALLADSQWMDEERAWRTMFRLTMQEQQILAAALRDRVGTKRSLLVAASDGPLALVRALRSEAGAEISRHQRRAGIALLEALHGTSNPKVSEALVRLSQDAETAVVMRDMIENSIAQNGWHGATAADWFAWSEKCRSFHVRTRAFSHVGKLLRRNDGAILDKMLSRVESTQFAEMRSNLMMSIVEGVGENSRPLQIPWTADRLFRIAQLDGLDNYSLNEALGFRWQMAEGRTMIADALLRHPAQLHPKLIGELEVVDEFFRMTQSDDSEPLLERDWSAEVAAQFQARYPKWSAEDRVAAIQLLTQTRLLSTDAPFPKMLRIFLQQQSGDESLRKTITEGLARVDDRWER